jgi:hypothetical protein
MEFEVGGEKKAIVFFDLCFILAILMLTSFRRG